MNFSINANTSDELDVLYIFPHTGLAIPYQFENLFNKNISNEEIRNSINANHDFGTQYLLHRLLIDFMKNDYKYGVAYYKYSRIFADANRIEVNSQIVDQPYRGVSPWKKDVNKEILSEKLLDPFILNLLDFIEKRKPKFIFHVHTMDTFGGGKASNGHDKGGENKRPASMIFKEYNHPNNGYGKYFKDEPIEKDLLTKEEIKKVKTIHSKYLKKCLADEEEAEITIDYPYIAPPQLCGVIYKVHECPQLILDIRKDMFKTKNSKELMYQSMVEISQQMAITLQLSVNKSYRKIEVY